MDGYASIMNGDEDGNPSAAAASTKDRVRKHRRLEKERQLQVALAAARLASGNDPRDSARALAAFLRKVASRKDVSPDAVAELEDAAALLGSRRRR